METSLPIPELGASFERIIPITITETVQARGETVTRERQTVQETSKLPRRYVLVGETQAQKLMSLLGWVSSYQGLFHQLELLGYIEDILAAPTTLETYEVTNAD